jgi:hypothetical protein
MIDYSDDIKTARLQVVRDALVGGRLELLQGKFMLARVPLGVGTIETDELSFAMSEGIATMKGQPEAARFIDYYGNTVADGLEVGTDVVLDADSLEVGQTVRIISAIVRHA